MGNYFNLSSNDPKFFEFFCSYGQRLALQPVALPSFVVLGCEGIEKEV